MTESTKTTVIAKELRADLSSHHDHAVIVGGQAQSIARFTITDASPGYASRQPGPADRDSGAPTSPSSRGRTSSDTSRSKAWGVTRRPRPDRLLGRPGTANSK